MGGLALEGKSFFYDINLRKKSFTSFSGKFPGGLSGNIMQLI